jgi:hypothetical protein
VVEAHFLPPTYQPTVSIVAGYHTGAGRELLARTGPWLIPAPLPQGIFVDVGADYDANVHVDDSSYTSDWEKILPLLPIDTKVTIRVKKLLPDTGRFVMPFEAELIQPDISKLCVGPPRLFPPIYMCPEEDEKLEPYAFAMEIGRPLEVRPIPIHPSPCPHKHGGGSDAAHGTLRRLEVKQTRVSDKAVGR